MCRVRVEEVALGGTIATCLGVDRDSGERVAFYVEHRAAAAIAAAVAAADELDELPVADVETWQLAGR